MADISAFRGIRYREDIALDDVVAPPYDVLSAAQAAELRARSPYNAVHVDLPVPPGAASDEEAYLRAAETFRTWRERGRARPRRAPRHRRRRPDLHGAGRPGAHPPRLRRAAAHRRPGRARGPAARAHARRAQGRPAAPVPGGPRRPQPDLPALPRRRRVRRRGPGGRRRGAARRRLARGARRRRQHAPLRGHGRPCGRARRRGAARPPRLHRRRPPPLRDRPRLSRRAAGGGRPQRRHAHGLPVQPERPGAHRVPHAPAAALHPAALSGAATRAHRAVLRRGRRAGHGRRGLPRGARGAAGAGRRREGLRPVPPARRGVPDGAGARAARPPRSSWPAASLPPPPASR